MAAFNSRIKDVIPDVGSKTELDINVQQGGYLMENKAVSTTFVIRSFSLAT